MLLKDFFIRLIKHKEGRSGLEELAHFLRLQEVESKLSSLDSIDTNSYEFNNLSFDLAQALSSAFEEKLEAFLKTENGIYNQYSFLYTLLDLSVPGLGEELRKVISNYQDLYYAIYMVSKNAKLLNFEQLTRVNEENYLVKEFKAFLSKKNSEEFNKIVELIKQIGKLWELYIEKLDDELKGSFVQGFNTAKKTVTDYLSRPQPVANQQQITKSGYKPSGSYKSFSTTHRHIKKSNAKVLVIITIIAIVMILISILVLTNRSKTTGQNNKETSVLQIDSQLLSYHDFSFLRKNS